METPAPTLAKLDEAMRAWFPPEQSTRLKERKPFTEIEFRGISDVLRRSGQQSWSRIPRIYAVLRTINQLDTIDIFVSSEITDVSFPFTQKTLPEALQSQSARCDFLEAQVIVLSKALDLERENGRHRHFGNAADIPFEKIAELGKGASGYVDRVRSTISYKEYARKLLPRGRTFRKDQAVLQEFEKELRTLKRLSHLHIVELIGSYTDPRFVGIVMSPIADCNLHEFMDKSPLPREELSFLRTFFGCLAAALRYLHENRVRHKDIKPQNILVKSHHVYLTDFGISLDWSELQRSTTTGPSSKTPRYCAPEVAADEPRKSSADIWSLGSVFLEIWTVLCGHSVHELNTHMTTNGSGLASYHSNIVAVSSWIELLRLGPSFDSSKPGTWISLMLEPNPLSRCTTQLLFDKIQEISLDPEVPISFTGLCCLEDQDSPESVISSIFEPDDFELMDQPSDMHESALAGPSMQPVIMTQNRAPVSDRLSTPEIEALNTFFPAPMEETSSSVARVGPSADPKAYIHHILSSINSHDPNEEYEKKEPIRTRQDDNILLIHRNSKPLQGHSNNEQENAREGADPPPILETIEENQHEAILLPNEALPPAKQTTLASVKNLSSRSLAENPNRLPLLEISYGSRTVNDVLHEWLQHPSFFPGGKSDTGFFRSLREHLPDLKGVSAEQIGFRSAVFRGNDFPYLLYETNRPAIGIARILHRYGIAFIVEEHSFKCLLPMNKYLTAKVAPLTPTHQNYLQEMRKRILDRWYSRLQSLPKELSDRCAPFYIRLAHQRLSKRYHFGVDTTAEGKRGYLVSKIIRELQDGGIVE